MTLLPAPPHRDHWFERVCAGSEMGERVLAHDWAHTPLGPPSTWSTALRTAVGVCLSSRFPMLVVWGPDLVKIYNDGYRQILGSEKHPRALGAPLHEIWPEIWDTIGPMLRGVLDTGEPTWTEHGLLLIDRNGFTEECYFVWSYSALYDDDGVIRGVLDVVTETTREVVAQRRLACLAELRGALVSAEQVTDVCLRATATLARFTADVRTADLYLLVGDAPVLIASNRREDRAGTAPADVAEVATSREPRTLGRHDGAVPTAERYLMPIGTSRTDVRGVMDVALNPMRPFDETYAEFLGLVGATIGTALENAYRRAVELGQFRAISDTLQAAMLRPASDLPNVAARYVPAAGNLAVGGDWYDVIDLTPGHRGVIVGDCVGHGLDAATAMGQLRAAARAMLLESHDPAATLTALDGFTAAVPGAEFATVVCAVFDRETNVVTYARAGHLPPLVVGRHGTTWLDGSPGAPLGADPSAPRANAVHQCEDEAIVVLYSDGLIEHRGESLDVGFARLADAATELRGLTVQQMADGLLTMLLPEPSRDDVVLVVKQLPTASR